MEADKIEVHRAEGLTRECVTRTVKTVEDAERIVNEMRRTAPPAGKGYNKVDVRVWYHGRCSQDTIVINRDEPTISLEKLIGRLLGQASQEYCGEDRVKCVNCGMGVAPVAFKPYHLIHINHGTDQEPLCFACVNVEAPYWRCGCRTDYLRSTEETSCPKCNWSSYMAPKVLLRDAIHIRAMWRVLNNIWGSLYVTPEGPDPDKEWDADTPPNIADQVDTYLTRPDDTHSEDRIPCQRCGLPIPNPPEGSTRDQLLCDKCYAQEEK